MKFTNKWAEDTTEEGKREVRTMESVKISLMACLLCTRGDMVGHFGSAIFNFILQSAKQWGDKWEEQFKDGKGTKKVRWAVYLV